MQAANDNRPTPYADLNAVLADLTASTTGILGGDFHAACLQGSFAMGDFDINSDVDFLIVVNEEVAEANVPALQAMHERIYAGPCVWAQHLEGSYIRKDVLRDYHAVGGEHWYLDHGARRLIRASHCNTIVVRGTVRDHGITLAGAEARTLVDPIPAEALLREVRGVIQDWGRDLLGKPGITSRWQQTFAVVNYCRMLQTMRTGKLTSKPAGVRWALENLDRRWSGLIERAWKDRPDPAQKCRLPVDSDDLKNTVNFLKYAIELAR